MIIQSKDGYRNIVVPLHKELKSMTIRAVIKQPDPTVEEFVNPL